jgi:hypothetical protein
VQVEVEEEQEEYEEEEEEGGGGASRPPGKGMEQEKRIRREIANSNERRRMQSINAGFSSLRSLLPHHEGIRQIQAVRIFKLQGKAKFGLSVGYISPAGSGGQR